MSEQVNYRQQWADGEIEAGTLLDAIDSLQYANIQLAQKFGVAHAEAEALRAENGRLKRTVDAGVENELEHVEERTRLRDQLEAARELLANLVAALLQYETDECNLIQRAKAFITATPAPEAPDHTEQHLEMVEQGERQEAQDEGEYMAGSLVEEPMGMSNEEADRVFAAVRSFKAAMAKLGEQP